MNNLNVAPPTAIYTHGPGLNIETILHLSLDVMLDIYPEIYIWHSKWIITFLICSLFNLISSVNYICNYALF